MFLYNLLGVLMISLLPCKSCEQTFQNVPVLFRHIKVYHVSDTYSCIFNDCHKHFNFISALQNHALKCNRADPGIKSKLQKCVKIKEENVRLNEPETEIFKIISKLYANPSMTNTTIDEFVKNIMTMSEKVSEYHQKQLKKSIPVEYHHKIDEVFSKKFFF